jgi:hypothetical protein
MNILLLIGGLASYSCNPSPELGAYTNQIKSAVIAKSHKELSCLLDQDLSESEKQIIFSDKFPIKTKLRTPRAIISTKGTQTIFSGQLENGTTEMIIYFVAHKVKINARSSALIQDMQWEKDYTATMIVWDGQRWKGKFSAFLVDSDDKY